MKAEINYFKKKNKYSTFHYTENKAMPLFTKSNPMYNKTFYTDSSESSDWDELNDAVKFADPFNLTSIRNETNKLFEQYKHEKYIHYLDPNTKQTKNNNKKLII